MWLFKSSNSSSEVEREERRRLLGQSEEIDHAQRDRTEVEEVETPVPIVQLSVLLIMRVVERELTRFKAGEPGRVGEDKISRGGES